jgi:hypothetical protein
MTQTTTVPVVGQELPEFVRETGFAYWNRYAAINDEFIPIHMYDEAGQAAGYPTAFGMGNLTWAYLHIALHKWFGDEARIAKASVQFRGAVTRGTQLHVRGVVTAVRPGSPGAATQVDLDVWAENSEGTKLAPGSATVELTTTGG